MNGICDFRLADEIVESSMLLAASHGNAAPTLKFFLISLLGNEEAIKFCIANKISVSSIESALQEEEVDTTTFEELNSFLSELKFRIEWSDCYDVYVGDIFYQFIIDPNNPFHNFLVSFGLTKELIESYNHRISSMVSDTANT